jgi:hypothetical protein
VFKRYLGRALLNTLGPLSVVSLYLFIIFEYFLHPASDDVVPPRIIDGKTIFYTWLILSIFLLDWARSGLAGLEAAALMKPALAPNTAMQLMWHLDRNWGQLSGWWNALVYTYKYQQHKFSRSNPALVYDGPGKLWWYLSLSSFILYAAVPLAGLSMGPVGGLFKHSDRLATVLGASPTTFDARGNLQVADLARRGWRTGSPTTPEPPTIFYAPEGTANVSTTFFEDSILALYDSDCSSRSVSSRTVTFFSGPRVAERVHGVAWGLLTAVSCSAVDMYHGLELIKVDNFSTWRAPGLSSQTNVSYNDFGMSPSVFFYDDAYGRFFQYIIANDRDPLSGLGEYVARMKSASVSLPIKGAVEIAIWQSYQFDNQTDTLDRMSDNPLVKVSDGYLGYGVRCTVSSDVGLASLDAGKRTFSRFQRQHALENRAKGDGPYTASSGPLYEHSGISAIQTIVLVALSGIFPGIFSAPTCLPALADAKADTTCSLVYGANLATGHMLANVAVPDQNSSIVLQPLIPPERMTLAMYKIFGEAAAAMMAVGSGAWTSNNLTGLDTTNDLVIGVVPWEVVLALLLTWAVITVVPQLRVFSEKRWSSTLEAFEIFRFGAEYREAVQQFESNEFTENRILRQVPGLIGDLEPRRSIGFVGLSRVRAQPKRKYTNDRAATRG